MAQVTEHLSSKHEALISNSSSAKKKTHFILCSKILTVLYLLLCHIQIILGIESSLRFLLTHKSVFLSEFNSHFFISLNKI
jgi:hypothetical protein